MNILFRLLVILSLAVNGVCWFFAKELEAKRELLLAGNKSLREYWGRMAPRLESDAAFGEGKDKIDLTAVVPSGTYVERDVSDTSLSTADMEPQYNTFWETYQMNYETKVTKSMSVDEDLLKEVFVLNDLGKPELDETGRPETKGAPLEMQLEPLLKAATAQRERLNETRTWLEKLRNELIDTITELNNVKKESRERVKTIDERDGTISTLEGEKATLQGEVADLKGQVEDLEADKASLESDLAAKEEELMLAKDEVEKYKKIIEDIVASEGNKPGSKANMMANIPAGVKGKVVRVDNAYGSCIVRLAPDVYNELVGEDGSKQLPDVQFYVKTPGKDSTMDSYKATVQLTAITKEANAVTCKILNDQVLEDIEVGDELYLID